MPKTIAVKKNRFKFVIDKKILEMFPRPDRMAQPVQTHWEKSSVSKSNPTKGKQAIRNSY